MAEEPVVRETAAQTRRHLLALAAAGGAAAVASLLPCSKVFAEGEAQPLYLGQENTGPESPTVLRAEVDEGFAVEVHNPAGRGAMLLTSGGSGEANYDSANPPAVAVESQTSHALHATTRATDSTAIEAGSPVLPAILAFGGVIGFGHTRAEDLLEGEPLGTGEGVIGHSEQPDKAAILGESVLLINRGYEGQPPAQGIGVLGRTGAAPGVGVIGEASVGPEFEDDPAYPDGVGVLGRSGSGIGVRGESATAAGIEGESHDGFGVSGISQSFPGVHGTSDTERGTAGVSRIGTGVQGDSFGGVGVAGIRTDARPDLDSPGAGVLGVAYGDNPGVIARSASQPPADVPAVPDGGIALRVEGKSLFSTAGSAAVPSGGNSVFVANPAVTAISHVTVTLVGDPGPRHLRWVTRNPGNGFTVHFEGGRPGQRPEVPFTYLVVEPA